MRFAALVDALAIALLVLSTGAFSLGVLALGDERDLAALYFLVVGVVLLRASTDLLRPRSSGR
jgi:hypothetical protein